MISCLQEPNRHKMFWETALNVSFTKDQWLQACVLANKCAISTRLQETNYWHKDPPKRSMLLIACHQLLNEKI